MALLFLDHLAGVGCSWLALSVFAQECQLSNVIHLFSVYVSSYVRTMRDALLLFCDDLYVGTSKQQNTPEWEFGAEPMLEGVLE